MGKALSYEVRQKIIERKKQGQSYQQIAEGLACSVSGVKKIWYGYQKSGDQILHNNYSNCGGHSIYGEQMHQQVVAMRDNQQGSYYVHSKLKMKYPDQQLPSSRTLNRWWRKAGSSRKRGRPSSSEKKDGLVKPTKLGK